ncbi:MAG: multidrug resistance protein [Sphingobacteriales bacterium]|jgi:multidrug resistance protein
MFINALSIGLIVPLMYPLSIKFGLNPTGLSLLFTSFSIGQFFATPIIGRLSDKYGRKPLLLICLAGTSLAFALLASAQSVVMLFAARIFDGITGGNISVANAVVADITDEKNKPKAFGILGASFGAGFLIGPAIGGVLSDNSISAPFWFACGLSAVGVVLGMFMLKESNKHRANERFLFRNTLNFTIPFKSLRKPAVGIFITLGLFTAMAHHSMIIGFQTYTVDILGLNPRQIGLFFTCFALIIVIMQAVGINVILKKISKKQYVLLGTLTLMFIGFITAYFSNTLGIFALAIFIYTLGSSIKEPLIQSLISERTKNNEQGKVLGIYQSYISMGQILGPLLAGLVALISIQSIFLFAAIMILFSLVTVIKSLRINKI